MSKFLVVYFDRYDTSWSRHEYVETDSFDDVLVKMSQDSNLVGEDQKELLAWLRDMYVQVSDEFGCVPQDETDYLIYKLQ